MEKINFSGGEPFIYKRGEFVGELTRYCKENLKMQSVSIVCNGSLVTERWFSKYGKKHPKQSRNFIDCPPKARGCFSATTKLSTNLANDKVIVNTDV